MVDSLTALQQKQVTKFSVAGYVHAPLTCSDSAKVTGTWTAKTLTMKMKLKAKISLVSSAWMGKQRL